MAVRPGLYLQRRWVEGVIFDLDGTLVDSRLDFSAIRAELGCPAGVDVLEYIDSLPEADQARGHEVVLRHEREGAERAEWMPGAEACLQRLKTAGIPVGVLTRNARDIARLTLSRLGGSIECLLAREDAAPKPAPDGLLHIAREWGQAPQQLAYVGDFRFDLEAARNADMAGVYYDPKGTNQHSHLADSVIQHFDELVPFRDD
ncbi:HAD family hydrolase [Alcanivorax sediminis]|uniref:HAD-IA family hydrolase n=1 Tax=Alcanivorax sediminis TaxID=2663008 RepID=A0A6N7LZK5_9GAMM|nr:HAD family hydrolase [Alcanivorax sediminis]MQX53530.1 HAD-IA family hydrolase [Alcanivorax sediminis]